MNALWYIRRLRRMSPREMAARFLVATRQRWWSNPARRPDLLATLLPGPRGARVALSRGNPAHGPAAEAAILAAESLLQGHWPVFHLTVDTTPWHSLPVEEEAREAAAAPHPPQRRPGPDWFRDPLTGRRAPHDTYCFRIPHRDEAAVGNIKFVWELSRHQPLTLLACAWWLTGDDRFADAASSHLRDWWRENPFLHGVHWTSGIEVGLRLLSWTWIRALLADWPGVAALFDDNPAFLRQLYAHSRYLSAFHSTGSSANNHLIAEHAGQLAASLAFPWFRESARWAAAASDGLARAAEAQTHPDGWNREQASGDHLFVAEMLAAAVLPARMAACPVPAVEAVLRRMLDALAASLDSAGQPPRFGDCDDARGMLVDAAQTSAVAALLDTGRALFGVAADWPPATGTVLGQLAARIAGAPPATRAPARIAHFPDAGITILRSGNIWLRCDAGPHGYGSLAAHGHADALSIELRSAGVEVLADPGTYCYHGEPDWRGLFRGTHGHTTLEVGGTGQAASGGPFLWLTQPRSALAEYVPDRAWQASHDGYGAVRHHRRVTLEAGTVTVRDWIDAARPHPVLLAFHLGPAIQACVGPASARLAWPGGAARVALPPALAWHTHRGELHPPFGWYSRSFGQREPATVLAGRGLLGPGTILETCFTLTKERPDDWTSRIDRRGEPAGSVRPPGVAGGDDARPQWRGRNGHLPEGERLHQIA